MGIDKDVAKFLLAAREHKANFQKSLTLGKQQFQVSASDYKRLAESFDLKKTSTVKDSEEFFRLLGAKEISAMDFSDYEGAAILHDLNEPIGDELKEKFTFVLDGGTLEHIFNFPVALAGAMEMVAVSGHLAIIAGGNNFFGHGFYQFSPELFFRVFNLENGFVVERMIAAEVGNRWFEVADPKEIGGRVELINDRPVYLMVLARKLERRTLFAQTPQQSDYVAKWHDETDGKRNGNAGQLKSLLKKSEFLRQTLIKFKQRQVENLAFRERSFSNKKLFTKLSVLRVLCG
jgi:hypothetical protein